MRTKAIFLFLLWCLSNSTGIAQKKPGLTVVKPLNIAYPLENVTLVCEPAGIISVSDGLGREYFKSQLTQKVEFMVGGTVGMHKATLSDVKGKLLSTATFEVKVETKVDDGGKIGQLFDLLYRGMLVYSPTGYEEVSWNGNPYRFYVNWVLDNNNTARGMKYFSPYGGDLVDLLRETQKPDGMIWSFVNSNREDYHYYETAYTPLNYFRKDEKSWFVRQPNENHVEYNYVNMMYQHWKASGDNEWMKKNLDCAARALDYCVTDSVKWSKRFQLLKRPYCIDSWDFQVDDEYTPFAHISPTMVLVPGKTKFGIFFGDNTGYYEACNQVSEMFASIGNNEKSVFYKNRGKEILERLTKLAWNGKYFTHFIDEDPNVKRNLGVDEKTQIAQGNMYSINRGLSHDLNTAIIKTYQELRKNLPAGSPGEWYAIYPPFEKGFGSHNGKWQYMNGGVAGHAIGELARGAYEEGYEDYASDIMYRLLDLGKKYGDRVWFAYTGAFPPAPEKYNFKTVNIAAQVNMDLWDKGAKNVFKWMNTEREGNDMRGLPVGEQMFNNIKFNVLDPDKNQRKACLAVSVKPGYPQKLEVPVNDTAATIYLLHSSSDNIPSNVAGAISFTYADGSISSQYIMKGKEVTNWWFSSLKNDHAGVAWWGPNLCSTKVGVCWAAISNPQPSKKISKLAFHAPLEGGIYAVIGITLSDKPHYVKPKGESFGGPDNWAAANGMAALVEGLAGIKSEGLAFSKVALTPRWTSANVDSVNAVVRFASSNGYVAYQYKNNVAKKQIEIIYTGSGNEMNCHILLPKGINKVEKVLCDGNEISFKQSIVENSNYVDFKLLLPKVQDVIIKY